LVYDSVCNLDIVTVLSYAMIFSEEGYVNNIMSNHYHVRCISHNHYFIFGHVANKFLHVHHNYVFDHGSLSSVTYFGAKGFCGTRKNSSNPV